MEIELNKIELETKKTKEAKSKQIHLLLTEANYNKLKKMADDTGRSMNDFINYIIEKL